MSTQVFPSLVGLTWKRIRAPNWETINQEAVSGFETRIALRPQPKWTWKMDFSYLGTGTLGQITNTDWNTLVGFYNARQGMYDSFLLTEPDDSTITGQTIGAGTGSLATFQMIRTLGGFTESILAPNTVSAVYLSAVSIPAAGYSAPTNGTLSSASAGALAATTYYVKTTWVTNSGETLPSVETSLAVAANKVLHVANPSSPPAGAIGWNVYISNTAGGGAGAETLQNGGTPIGTGSIFTEPTSGLVAGAALPVANTTGWSVSTWGSATPGILTFAGNVVNTIAVTADFTYYWPVRFDSDKNDFSNDMQYLWSLNGLTLKQVYN